jgi:hypothetical protein
VATDAPRWLTEAFALGVVEHQGRPLRPELFEHEEPPVLGTPRCWLQDHDPRRRPCSGRLERFHFIPRQRVEAIVWEQLREAVIRCGRCEGAGLLAGGLVKGDLCPECFGRGHFAAPTAELVQLAAWDARNGELGCEGHHRRFDRHLTPPLIVVSTALPDHVVDFAHD